MYIRCDGCGRIIAEQDDGRVLVKHRGRAMRIVEGEVICECGTTTRIVGGIWAAAAPPERLIA